MFLFWRLLTRCKATFSLSPNTYWGWIFSGVTNHNNKYICNKENSWHYFPLKGNIILSTATSTASLVSGKTTSLNLALKNSITGSIFWSLLGCGDIEGEKIFFFTTLEVWFALDKVGASWTSLLSSDSSPWSAFLVSLSDLIITSSF